MTYRRIDAIGADRANSIARILKQNAIFHYYSPYGDLHVFDIPNWETVDSKTQMLIALLE